jgi:hypothetical protein
MTMCHDVRSCLKALVFTVNMVGMLSCFRSGVTSKAERLPVAWNSVGPHMI